MCRFFWAGRGRRKAVRKVCGVSASTVCSCRAGRAHKSLQRLCGWDPRSACPAVLSSGSGTPSLLLAERARAANRAASGQGDSHWRRQLERVPRSQKVLSACCTNPWSPSGEVRGFRFEVWVDIQVFESRACQSLSEPQHPLKPLKTRLNNWPKAAFPHKLCPVGQGPTRAQTAPGHPASPTDDVVLDVRVEQRGDG